jgi:hypothetical protein
MDEEGGLLGRAESGEALDFPMITGLEQDVKEMRRRSKGRDVQQALSLLRVLQGVPSLGRVSEIHVDGDEGLGFILEGFSVPVRVGWTDFPAKLARFEKALPLLGLRSNAMESVDLRFSDQIIVRQREGGEPRILGGSGTDTRAGSVSMFDPRT